MVAFVHAQSFDVLRDQAFDQLEVMSAVCGRRKQLGFE